MNIQIYYHDKIIRLHLPDQSSRPQAFKALDRLSEEALQEVFKGFIQQNDESTLDFDINDLDAAIAKFGRAFHLIEAAGGLIEKDGKHLFIRRFEKWDLPKGKLDKGETPEHAAIRECEEECGINELTIQSFITNIFHMYDYKDSYAIKKTWWYHMSSSFTGTLVPQLEEHIDRVEWFDRSQIEEVALQNTYPAIKEVLRKANLI